MQKLEGRRAKRSRGRKQDKDRTEAILSAAAEVLFETGYDNLRIQDVAERAKSGTGAIYRRWNDKDCLVAEAIHASPCAPSQVTDDPAVDLAKLIRTRVTAAATNPDLIPGLISAMRSNDQIDSAMRTRCGTHDFRRNFARLLGDDCPHLDLLADLVPALILHRTIFGETALDEQAYTDQLLGLVNLIAESDT